MTPYGTQFGSPGPRDSFGRPGANVRGYGVGGGVVLVAVAENLAQRVMRSADAGLTWQLVTVPLRQWHDVAANNDGRLLAVARNNAGTDNVMLSDDGGLTWVAQDFPFPFLAFGVAWSEALGLWGVSGQSNGGGNIDDFLTSPTGETGSWVAQDDNEGTAAGRCIFHEADGRFWEVFQSTPRCSAINLVGPSDKATIGGGLDRNIAYSARLGRALSTDTGLDFRTAATFNTWSAAVGVLSNTGQHHIADSAAGRIVVFDAAGGNPRLQFSDDDGASFVACATQTAPQREWENVKRSETLGLFMAVSNSDASTSLVGVSADGDTWAFQPTPNDAHYNAICAVEL